MKPTVSICGAFQALFFGSRGWAVNFLHFFSCCNWRTNSVLRRLPTIVRVSVVPSDWERIDLRGSMLVSWRRKHSRLSKRTVLVFIYLLHCRLKPGNACYNSVHNILFCSLLSKNIETKIYRTTILLVVLYGCETWPLTLREKGVWE